MVTLQEDLDSFDVEDVSCDIFEGLVRPGSRALDFWGVPRGAARDGLLSGTFLVRDVLLIL